MGAIAVHHTATEDSPWDGSAAVAAMPNDAATLRYCHAWVDPNGEADKKSSYKFPHARTKGGPANLGACRNGLARLSNSSIPEGDKDGVKKHLQAHLDDAAKKSEGRAGPLAKTERWREGVKSVLARAGAKLDRTSWYRINNRASADTAEIFVYDEIGMWGQTASDFIRDLAGVTAKKLTCRINSPGGEVFDGIAIYNALRSHPAHVTVQVDSLAASVASVIAMAGDTVLMCPGAQMMIHDAAGLCMGNADDMTAMAELLDRQSDNIAGFYAARAGGTAAAWRDVMRGEAWFNADEALAAGLADGMVPQHPEPDGDEMACCDCCDSTCCGGSCCANEHCPGPCCGGETETEPDGDEEPVRRGMPTARWDLSVFRYAGREQAPAPVVAAAVKTPGRAFPAAPRAVAAPAPADGGPVWDDDLADALIAAMSQAPDEESRQVLVRAGLIKEPEPTEPDFSGIDPTEWFNAIREGIL